MTYPEVSVTELRIAANCTTREMNIFNVVQAIHGYVTIDGYILSTESEVLAMTTLQKIIGMLSGELATERLQKAYILLNRAVSFNEARTPGRKRQKKSEQVAVAA